jgi:hypothetical protein
LTKGSYYNFLRVKVTDKDTYLEAIGLPSPANTAVDRYLVAGQLFAKALFKEYKKNRPYYLLVRLVSVGVN